MCEIKNNKNNENIDDKEAVASMIVNRLMRHSGILDNENNNGSGNNEQATMIVNEVMSKIGILDTENTNDSGNNDNENTNDSGNNDQQAVTQVSANFVCSEMDVTFVLLVILKCRAMKIIWMTLKWITIVAQVEG